MRVNIDYEFVLVTKNTISPNKVEHICLVSILYCQLTSNKISYNPTTIEQQLSAVISKDWSTCICKEPYVYNFREDTFVWRMVTL